MRIQQWFGQVSFYKSFCFVAYVVSCCREYPTRMLSSLIIYCTNTGWSKFEKRKKKGGRSRYCYFDSSRHSYVTTAANWSRSLYRSLHGPFFSPTRSICTTTINRWYRDVLSRSRRHSCPWTTFVRILPIVGSRMSNVLPHACLLSLSRILSQSAYFR